MTEVAPIWAVDGRNVRRGGHSAPTAAAAGEALNIGLETDHEILSPLIVVADLAAAEEPAVGAGQVGVGHRAERRGDLHRQRATQRIGPNRTAVGLRGAAAERSARVQTDVEAGPCRDRRRSNVSRGSLARGKISCIGRAGGQREAERSGGKEKIFHWTVPSSLLISERWRYPRLEIRQGIRA